MEKLTAKDWSDISDQLSKASKGRWDYLAPRLAPVLSEAAGRMGKHVACPHHNAHADTYPRFRLHEKTGLAYCSCRVEPIQAACYKLGGHTNWAFFLKDWAELLHMEDLLPMGLRNTASRERKPPPPPPAPVVRELSPKQLAKKRANLQQAWNRYSLPKPNGILHQYQDHRGFDFCANGDVRETNNEPYRVSVPAAFVERYGKFVTLGHFPCIVHLVRDCNGQPCGFNKIFVVNGRKLQSGDFKDLPEWVDPVGDLPAKRRSNWLPFKNDEAYVVLRKGTGKDRFHGMEGIECGWAVDASTPPEDTVVAHLSNTLLEKNTVACQERGYASFWIWGDHDLSQAGDTTAWKLLVRKAHEGMPTRVMLPSGDVPEGERSLDWDYIYRNLNLRELPTWKERLQKLMSVCDQELSVLRTADNI